MKFFSANVVRTPSGVRFLWWAALVGMLSLSGCDQTAAVHEFSFRGHTMGTTWSITVVDVSEDVTREDLQSRIEQTLLEFNQQMSNWIEDSEISRFNQSDSTDWIDVSPATSLVISESIRIWDETAGAFDITVAPLINAWGFGPEGRMIAPPSEEELLSLRAIIGSDKLQARQKPSAIRKTSPDLTVNLSAIAKGYGVDVVAESLESHGITNYLVEIGGEVRVSGLKSDGTPWRVGIERPEDTKRSLLKAISLTNRALATSGDYRNFVERDGKKYSHTIDPQTMKPITHTLASVSVLSETCLDADALATALMVMGPKKGYAWAEARDLAVLMLIHKAEGFEERATTAWTQTTGETP